MKKENKNLKNKVATKKEEKMEARVMQKLQEKKAQMKPKSFFVGKNILWGSLAALSAFLSLYFASLLFFRLRASGAWYLTGFGPRGIMPYLSLFPWIIFILAIILIILLEVFLQKVAPLYRNPVLYIVCFLLFFMFVAGFFLEKTHLHNRFYQMTQGRPMPFVHGIYPDSPEHCDNLYMGQVIETSDNAFMLRERDNQEVKIYFDDDTRFVPPKEVFVNDYVFALVENEAEKLEALGVRFVKDFEHLPFRPMPNVLQMQRGRIP